MRSCLALRKASAFAMAALALAWAESASSLSCVGTLAPEDVARLGLVEPAALSATGDIEVARSPSGEFRSRLAVGGEPLIMRLYRQDTLVSSFPRPLPSTREFLLDDGTYIAFERPPDCINRLDQSLVVVSASGSVLWKREARSLVPEEFRVAFESTRVSANILSWMVDARVSGRTLAEAKLIVRLSNYDDLEIAVTDAGTRLIGNDDFGDDVVAWRGRALWDRLAGDLDRSVQGFLRAQALGDDDSLQEILLIYELNRRYDLAEAQLKAAIAQRPLSSAQSGGPHYRPGFEAGQTAGHPIWLHRELADVYARSGNAESALAVLDDVLRQFPSDWWTNVDRANLTIDAGNRERLRGHIENIFQLNVAAIDDRNESEASKRSSKEIIRRYFLDWLVRHRFSEQSTAMLREDLAAAGASTSSITRAATLGRLADAAIAERDYARYVDYLTQADRLSSSSLYASLLVNFYLGRDGHVPDFRAALQWQLRVNELQTQLPGYPFDSNFRLCYLSYAAAEPKSWSAGVEWCRRGAEAGEPPSRFWLALLLLDGKVVPRDVEAAEALLSSARESAGPFSFNVINGSFSFSLINEQGDLAPFVTALEAHAAQGSKAAAYFAGTLHRNGYGVPTSPEIALRWFEQAAKQGDKDSQYEYATLLASRGDARAIEWLAAAAAQGHSFAAFDLGGIYYEGVLTPRNLPVAREWLETSARLYGEEQPGMRGRGIEAPAGQRLREWFPDEYSAP